MSDALGTDHLAALTDIYILGGQTIDKLLFPIRTYRTFPNEFFRPFPRLWGYRVFSVP